MDGVNLREKCDGFVAVVEEEKNNENPNAIVEGPSIAEMFNSFFPQTSFAAFARPSEAKMTKTLYEISRLAVVALCNPARSHIRKLIYPSNKISRKGARLLLRILCTCPEVIATPAIQMICYVIHTKEANELFCVGLNGRIVIHTMASFSNEVGSEVENKVFAFGVLANMLFHSFGQDLIEKYHFLIIPNLDSALKGYFPSILQVAMATFYYNMSVYYGEKIKRDPNAIHSIIEYKQRIEKFLGHLTNENAFFLGIIALGSFMVHGQTKSVKKDTLKLLFTLMEIATLDTLQNICILFLSHILKP